LPKLNIAEKDALNKIVTELNPLPTEETKFVEMCLKDNKDVPAFNPRNYEL